MNKVPANDLPLMKVPAEDIPGGFVGGLKDAGQAVAYNANKMGAGINAGLANINETLGLDSSTFRDNQDYYKQNAQDLAQPDRPFLQEAYNPINYAVAGRGAGLAGSLVGSAYANEGANSATTGEDFDTGRANTQASVGLGVSSALPIVGQGINSAKNMILQSGGKSGDEINALQALAKKYGVQLTPATSTGSATLARTEHGLEGTLAGSLGVNSVVKKEADTINDAINTGFNRMGANGSNTNAGDMFATGVKEVIDNEKKYFTETFGKMFAKYGDEPVFSIRGVKNEANKLIGQAERNPIIKNSTAYRDAVALSKTDDMLTWADWSKLRTHLGGLTQDTMATGKASTGAYKQMYGQMQDDLQSSVYNIGDIGTLKQYNKVVDEYKDYKNTFDGTGSGARFINAISRDKQNPETIGHSINNSTLKARGALEAGGFDRKSGLPSAKKVSATDALLSSKLPDGVNYSMPKFIKNTDKEGFKVVAGAPDDMIAVRPSTNAQRELFGADVTPSRAGANYQLGKKNAKRAELGRDPFPVKQGVDAEVMSDLGDIAKAIMAKQSHRNSSNTAYLNKLNAMTPITFAKDALISASYRTDMFKKWLSSGSISRAQYQEGIKNITGSTGRKAGRATNILLGSENNRKDQ